MPFIFLMLPPQTAITRGWARLLAAELPFVQVVAAETAAEATAAIPTAEAAFGTLTPALLAAAGRLRWLQAPQAAPPAGYYFPDLVSHPADVTNMRGIYNDHIGAHILAFVLAFARDFPTYLPAQLRGKWSPRPLDTGVLALDECTALIVGLGGIGAEAARLLAAFGVRVLATDARRTAPSEGVTELHPPAALDGLLGRADFVVLTVPHTPATEGFMDRARFRRMKPGAFFINIGRGRTTKLDDLADALRAGELAGAGLDVFETEPLPAGHPLWTLPGVLITPHTAGYGPHLDERRYAIIRDNCRAFEAGTKLCNLVDKANWF
ncbi:MAG: D-2-hydroxyacid dehydrogenase [Rhodospirillales bacterium]|nr:D-2-hydroxyacid dehydrogenase [Rhodospirillales bacterium]